MKFSLLNLESTHLIDQQERHLILVKNFVLHKSGRKSKCTLNSN